MSDAVNLFAQQEANRRRSQWLVVGFVLFFAWLGFGGDFIFYEMTRDAKVGQYHHSFPLLGLVLTLIAGGIAWYAWRTGPEKVLWATGAREVVAPTTPEEQQLVNVVEEMSVASGLPRPRIWIVPDADPNAFATGRDENSSSIAVTQGLLSTCTRDELQGVIGHEMGHIKNLDVRLMTLLAALVGAVALISNGASRMIFNTGGSSSSSRGISVTGGSGFSGGSSARGGGGGDDEGKGAGALMIVLLVLWTISWLLAPLVTRLLALGVSRKREFLADAMSAQFTRNPMALATALEKIERADAPTRSIKSGAAHLCIADPLGRRLNDSEGFFANLFGTHPPMALRVARLKAMAYQDLKRTGQYVAPEPSATV